MIELSNLGHVKQYKLRDYNEEELWLSCSEPGENEVLVSTPLRLDNMHRDLEFDAHFLFDPALRESDIYQVYSRESDARIGWIIPLVALDSDQHDFSENEHFLRYAWVAIRKALSSPEIGSVSRSIEVANRESVGFSELFLPGVALLVVSCQTLGGARFDVDRVVPSLLANGFISASLKSVDDVGIRIDRPTKKRVYLEFVSPAISCKIVASLVVEAAKAKSELLRFFYLYQLIEMMIEHVFSHEQGSVVQEIIENRSDSSRVKDAIQKMHEIVGEKKRISLLMTKYCRPGELARLREACLRFLSAVDRRREDSSFEGFLYPVRNVLFHQFRDVGDAGLAALADVNYELIKVIPSVVSTFTLDRPSAKAA